MSENSTEDAVPAKRKQRRLSPSYFTEKYGAAFLANGLLMSEKRKYVYVVNYRCGSSSIRDMLVQLETTGTVEENSDVGNPRRAARRTLQKFFDGDDETVEARLTNPDFVWFSMVRHPVTRLASAYASKIAMRLQQEARVRDWLIENGIRPGVRITFDQFLTYLENVSLRRVDRHWRLQRDVLLYDDVRYDVLGRMENFEGDMIAILKRLGVEAVKLPVINAKSSTYGFIAALTPADIDRIYRIYEADFDTFRYQRLPAD